jgi:NAD(P)-dependent dehydrogenase (short-subunit alcohol dehydrogenase family)
MSWLKDRVVIVTGATAGIGEATVRRLVGAGARVVLHGRRAERLQRLCTEVDREGKRTRAVAGDVAIAADREALVKAALDAFGRIDALVNNAGYGQRGPVECVPLDDVRRNYETNVFGLIGMTQLVAPHLRGQGEGRIINVSSVAGRIARPLSSIYDSTKHAVEAISDGLRGELAPFGVRVIVVRPGFIQTEFVEKANELSADALARSKPYAKYIAGFRGASARLRRVAAEPDDIARVIEKALSVAKPRTHYAAPRHAKFFLFVKWLLPNATFDRIVRLKE